MTEHQLNQMFLNFYPNTSVKKAELFAKTVSEIGKNLSAAQVQGYFMLCKNDSEKALENMLFFKK
jgi:chaperone BCS1